jgi:preprotein translocase subunit YajC
MNWLVVNALLDAAAPVVEPEAAAAGGSPIDMLVTLLPIVAMIVVFYFLLIRPQRKKDKAVKDMLSKVKVSDRVTTIGGFFGTVSTVKDDTITILVGPQKVPMVVARWAIKSIDDQPLENDAEPAI